MNSFGGGSLLLASLALLAGGMFAVGLLRRAWAAGPVEARPWLISAGWLAILVTVVAPVVALGAARGPFIASALASTAMLAVVAAGLKIRGKAKPARGEVAEEPSERASKAWRGWLRAILAGPLGGVAAMGVGLTYVMYAPGEPQTRMVLGGLLVPLLWAAGMAWTLSDDKILRATAVLSGVTVVTFAASALKGFS